MERDLIDSTADLAAVLVETLPKGTNLNRALDRLYDLRSDIIRAVMHAQDQAIKLAEPVYEWLENEFPPQKIGTTRALPKPEQDPADPNVYKLGPNDAELVKMLEGIFGKGNVTTGPMPSNLN